MYRGIRCLLLTFLLLSVVGTAMPAALGYTGAVVSVTDVAPSDVPGPQPIRVFPIPAAAGSTAMRLAYDNSAQLGFSSGYTTPAYRNWVNWPLTAPGITINNVTYNSGSQVTIAGVDNNTPTTNHAYGYFTNQDQVPVDNRFPAHIPRPGRFAGNDYSSVQFSLANPVKQFGVYVAMNSNTGTWPWNLDDDNNIKVHWEQYSGGGIATRKLWIIVQGVSDSFAAAQAVQVTAGGMYAPFVRVVWNGADAIKSVSVIQDTDVEEGAPFGFFDVYASLTGDINSDGFVNVGDLQLLVAGWGKSKGDVGFSPSCDVNADTCISVADLQLLVANWGRTSGI